MPAYLNISIELPLHSLRVIDKPLDWTNLWQNWAHQGPAVLLESSGPMGDASQWVIVAGGVSQEVLGEQGECYFVSNGEKTLYEPGIWALLDEMGRNQDSFKPFPHGLAQAWFGLFSYEFGHGFVVSKAASGGKTAPDFYFFKPSQILAFNRQTKELYRFGEELLALDETPREKQGLFQVGPVVARVSAEKYESNVRQAQDYIASGDIYQANLAQSFQASWQGSAASLYSVLREINPGPFMGLFRGPNFTVVSSSPERLIAGQGDWLEARPIAGTRPRGTSELEDLQQKSYLHTNPKEQAEHLMLVDLARNDLGRVSDYGTVEVKRYADVESYARVHHLVSTVQGRKKKTAGVSDVLKAIFPAGTITGCPKIRCMEIIQELEQQPRGFYTGSMGYVGLGPVFDFNILIRTFTLWDNGLLDFYAGAGIVADSDPKREYMETLYKVEALAQALGTTLLKKQF
ncbi:MAG TPA: anthranilate synthase component I family protein [bacterium]|jgi:anthranilate/para-aminobenzoate synthase component I|nr:anthranilate synthase component I family protein [bacterium]